MPELPGPESLHPFLSPSRRAGPTGTLAGLLARSLREHAGDPAVVGPDGELSYAQLGARAGACAGWLAAHGVALGDRAVLLGVNAWEFVVAECATVLGGFVRVGLTPRLHPEEVRRIVADCEPAVLFLDEVWLPEAATITADLGRRPLVVALGPPAPGADVALGELAGPAADPDDLARAVGPEQVAYLYYTSGTSGSPKGCVVTHRSMVGVVTQMNQVLPDLDGTEQVLHVAPLAHFSGVVMLASLVRGGSQHPVARYRPEVVLDAITHGRGWVVPMVPTMVNAVVDAQIRSPRETLPLRCLFYVGSPIAPDRLRRAVETFGPVLVQSYALSEAPLALTELSKGDHRRAVSDPVWAPRLASAGRPLPVVDVRIRSDDEAGEGQIALRSATMMQGYWRRPEETARVFDDEGWLLTGDVGRLDERGYLYVTDRMTDMVITGGFNVYPTEIENVLYRLDWVRECSVLGTPDPRWGEALVAVVVGGPGDADATTAAEVAERHCREHLAAYKVPRRFVFRAELPKSPTGKVLRRALRDELGAGVTTTSARSPRPGPGDPPRA